MAIRVHGLPVTLVSVRRGWDTKLKAKTPPSDSGVYSGTLRYEDGTEADFESPFLRADGGYQEITDECERLLASKIRIGGEG